MNAQQAEREAAKTPKQKLAIMRRDGLLAHDIHHWFSLSYAAYQVHARKNGKFIADPYRDYWRGNLQQIMQEQPK